MSPRERDLLAASLGWRLCAHARRAAAERGFTVTDVLLACVDPDVAYDSVGYRPARRLHQRGRVAVVLCPDTRTVVTVLLNSRTPWTDGDARSAHRTAA